MKKVHDDTVSELIELSRLLGEFGQINRVTLLPSGDPESDSHHSFALALIAYELARQYAPELDAHRIMLYALVHDLPELVTGDVVTLTASNEQLDQKAMDDTAAMTETKKRLASAPHVFEAVKEYEAKQNDEALFVYWIDKVITIPTHFYDQGANLRKLGIKNQHDIELWYERTLRKLQKQSGQPHASAVEILERAYYKMHDELLDV